MKQNMDTNNNNEVKDTVIPLGLYSMIQAIMKEYPKNNVEKIVTSQCSQSAYTLVALSKENSEEFTYVICANGVLDMDDMNYTTVKYTAEDYNASKEYYNGTTLEEGKYSILNLASEICDDCRYKSRCQEKNPNSSSCKYIISEELTSYINQSLHTEDEVNHAQSTGPVMDNKVFEMVHRVKEKYPNQKILDIAVKQKSSTTIILVVLIDKATKELVKVVCSRGNLNPDTVNYITTFYSGKEYADSVNYYNAFSNEREYFRKDDIYHYVIVKDILCENCKLADKCGESEHEYNCTSFIPTPEVIALLNSDETLGKLFKL